VIVNAVTFTVLNNEATAHETRTQQMSVGIRQLLMYGMLLSTIHLEGNQCGSTFANSSNLLAFNLSLRVFQGHFIGTLPLVLKYL